MRLPLRFWICLTICLVSRADAGLAPEFVLLVVNGDSAASRAIADEYVRLREIPKSHVVTLSGITNVEQMPVDDFRKQILQPMLDALDERGLRAQIRCVAYSADLPTAIHVASDVGNRPLPQILTPMASINGLTYLHQLVLEKDVRYLDLNANLYARRPGVRSSDTPWDADELKRYRIALDRLEVESRPRGPNRDEAPADALRPANDASLHAALETLRSLKASHPQSPELLYNLACSLATLGKDDEAIDVLKAAVVAGWFDHRHASRDPDLRSVRGRDDFKSSIDAMKSVKLDVQPARGFRSDVAWQASGESSGQDEAPRYLLSTVLAVTAGRGVTTDEAIAGLGHSTAADGTRPSGTIYFERNGDIRSTTREWGFASAVDRLRELGVDAVIEDGILPQKKDKVAGAMIGIADFDWPKSESTILPGAIVEHLTSFGGVMTHGAGQTPLTEFLRHGAAGASGTVTEPYAVQAKFPNPFIHVHYASGVSLAEAFYLSVTGPYQLLIVGDPLCTPWRRDFRLSVKARSTDTPWQGNVPLSPAIESSTGIAMKEVVICIDGRQISTYRPGEMIDVDTSKLTGGEHHLTVLAIGNDAVETIARWSCRFSCNSSNKR